MPVKTAATAKVATAKGSAPGKPVKAAKTATVKKPGCGSGSGGFKPGNTCGKTAGAKRQALADKIRTVRAQSKGSAGETKAVRDLALELKKHRRGGAGAIGNDRAKEHLAKLDGATPGKPVVAKAGASTPVKVAPAPRGAPKDVPVKATPAKAAPAKAPEKATPASQPAPPPGATAHGMTAAKIAFDTKADAAAFDASAKQIFDRPVTHADVATLAGVPDGHEATIAVRPHGITVTSDHDGVYIHRIISRDSKGKTYIKNDVFTVSKDQQGKGIGLSVFGRQVEHARRLGIDRIDTVAARSYDTENRQGLIGYKVWPKFGYDAKLADVTSDRNRLTLPKGLKKSKNVSDLMKSPEGRAWWEENGGSAEMSFDLKAGSLSGRVWDAYRDSKGGKGK